LRQSSGSGWLYVLFVIFSGPSTVSAAICGYGFFSISVIASCAMVVPPPE
jgi:hypothetical protein